MPFGVVFPRVLTAVGLNGPQSLFLLVVTAAQQSSEGEPTSPRRGIRARQGRYAGRLRHSARDRQQHKREQGNSWQTHHGFSSAIYWETVREGVRWGRENSFAHGDLRRGVAAGGAVDGMLAVACRTPHVALHWGRLAGCRTLWNADAVRTGPGNAACCRFGASERTLH